MSERFDKVSKDVLKITGNFFDRTNYAFEQMVDLSRALKSNKTILAICNERFDSFCEDPTKRLIPADVVLESFKKLELQIAAKLSEEYKKGKSEDLIIRARRAIAYYHEISNFSGSTESVTLTFEWFGKDKKRNEREIDYLFKLLNGANTAKINLLHSNVSREHFLNLFTGKSLPSKIIWNYDLDALPYLFDKLFHGLSVPATIDNTKNKTDKVLRRYLNERMAACFLDRNGKSFRPTNLTSLRSKFKFESEKAKLIDEIYDALFQFQNHKK